MTPHSLLAYDAAGNVVATLDYVVARDSAGTVVGLIDFAAHEAAGGEFTDILVVDTGAAANPVKGVKTWPEWLGGAAHNFRVELRGRPGAKRIVALVHKTSGHRRGRVAIEAVIKATPVVDGAKDIRHLVGGPGKPLLLDEDGRTIGPDHPLRATGTPAHLPVIGKDPEA